MQKKPLTNFNFLFDRSSAETRNRRNVTKHKKGIYDKHIAKLLLQGKNK
jgi:hypothetical protein